MSTTFNYTGATQCWTATVGASAVTFDVYGAAGGTNVFEDAVVAGAQETEDE